MGELIPVSLNYHDLSLNRTESEWSQYRTFKEESGSDFAFGGISHPDGAFNLYGTTPEIVAEVADEMLAATGNCLPPALRGGQATELLLKQHRLFGSATPVKVKRFVPLFKRATQTPVNEKFFLRRATVSDATILERWTTQYNQELNENFKIITAGLIENREAYILEEKDTEKSIGGYFRTVPNPDRYWLSRFYVFPEHRGQHFGTILFSFAMNQLTTQKELHLHVVSTNQNAIEFYEHQGMSRLEPGFNAQFS